MGVNVKKVVIVELLALLVASGLGAIFQGGNVAHDDMKYVVIYGTPPKNAEIVVKYTDHSYLCRVPESMLSYLRSTGVGYVVVKGLDTISLNYGTIKISEKIGIPDGWRIDSYPGEYGYYIVKFIGPIKTSWLKDLARYGRIYDYIPYYAYLVKLRNDDVQRVKSLDYVSWVGLYQPAYKLENASMMDGKGLKPFIVTVYDSKQIYDVADRIRNMGAKWVKVPEFSRRPVEIRVLMDYSLLRNVAMIPEVKYVQEMPKITLYNNIASRIVRSYDAWESTRNRIGIDLKGDGEIVGVADSGLDRLSSTDDSNILDDFKGKIVNYHYYADPSGNLLCLIYGAQDSKGDGLGHGTHVAGSILGNGALSEEYQGYPTNDDNYDHAIAGMAPNAKIVVQEIFTDNGMACGLMNSDLTTILMDAYNDGARIHSNSWGGQSDTYDQQAADADNVTWQHKDYIVLFAAGNSGPNAQTLGSPATAKNVITVGASENYRPDFGDNADNVNEMADFSSRGPVDDGRIKPDVAAPGTWILSTRSSVMQKDISWGHWPWDANGDGIDDYCFMGGTSMATPVTAGTVTLIRQFYRVHEGITPSSALVKATLINGAVDMGYGYPSNDQGWGRIDIKHTLFPDPPVTWKYWDEGTGLNTGETWTQSINVVDSSTPLKISLVWTDYPASANANPALVNDLNLKVIDPDGNEYHGNVFTDSWSTQNPSSWDDLNNVENVFIENPATGTWTIEVDASNVPNGPQPFAVVARGGLGPQFDNFVALTSQDNWMQVVKPGNSVSFSINVYNYGTSADTVSLSADSINGLSVSFSSSSVSLASSASQSVTVTVSADSSASDGSYDLNVHATSQGDTGIQDTITFKIVVRSQDVPSPVDFSSETGGQSSMDYYVKDGTLYIAYLSGEDGGKAVYIRYSSDGVNWQKERVSTGTGCASPDIWVDGNNNIIVTWIEGTDVKMRYKSSGGWSSEITLGSATDSNYPRVDEPTIAQDGDGYIWIFYKDLAVSNNKGYWQIKYVKSSNPNDPSGFSSPAAAPFTSANMSNYITDAFTASNGDMWVAYYQRNPDASPGYRKIEYAVYDGSSWSNGSVEANSQGDNYYPKIFEDSSGRIWFSWYSTRGGSGFQIYMAYYSSGSWSSTRGPVGTSTPYAPWSTMFQMNDGRLGIAYIEYSNPYGAGNVILAYSTDDFSTYTKETITADALGKSQVIAVHMPDKLWVIYSSTTLKGGEWSGLGEMTANNDADLYIVSIDDTAVPELNPMLAIALLAMVFAFLWRRR